MNKDDLAERLILSVINAEENGEKLTNFPHIVKGSFAILSQLCIGEKNMNGQYTACITVTNDLLNNWEMTKEELFSLSKENSKKLFPVTVEPIEELIPPTSELFLTDGVAAMPGISVLSNKQCFNGVASMFYAPETLDQIAESFNVENIYMLPSSVNQVYCIPVNSAVGIDDLETIFKTLAKEVEENLRVCESVLVYDSTKKEVSELNGGTYNMSLTAEETLLNNITHHNSR